MDKTDQKTMNPIELLQLKNAISQMDDDVTIGADYAALYLDMSEKTLANHRQKGVGPDYIQPKTSVARNQGVSYKLRALRAWQSLHTFKSPMEAAGARGLCRQIENLFEEHPFWVDSEGNFIDSVSEESTRELVESGTDAQMRDVSLQEALGMNWANSGRKLSLLDEVRSAFDAWHSEVNASTQSSMLKQRFSGGSSSNSNPVL